MTTVTVTSPPCVVCGGTQTFELDKDAYDAWRAGAHIQHVFPHLSAADREKLISGTCDKCFDALFPPDGE